MKKFLAASLALVAVSLTGASLLITQDQAIVSGIVEELKFEFEAPPRGIVGAPPVFKASKATLKFLEGKRFQIENDGSIKVLAGR
jgi:hypothetical protein